MKCFYIELCFYCECQCARLPLFTHGFLCFSRSNTFGKKGPLEYQMVTKIYLSFNLCDSSAVVTVVKVVTVETVVTVVTVVT